MAELDEGSLGADGCPNHNALVVTDADYSREYAHLSNESKCPNPAMSFINGARLASKFLPDKSKYFKMVDACVYLSPTQFATGNTNSGSSKITAIMTNVGVNNDEYTTITNEKGEKETVRNNTRIMTHVYEMKPTPVGDIVTGVLVGTAVAAAVVASVALTVVSYGSAGPVLAVAWTAFGCAVAAGTAATTLAVVNEIAGMKGTRIINAFESLVALFMIAFSKDPDGGTLFNPVSEEEYKDQLREAYGF